MEVVNVLAQFFGLSPGAFLTLVTVSIVLIVGWVVVKTVVRIAWKTFISGCLLLVFLLGGLFVGFVLINVAR